jgi:hypothetical protein
VAYRCATCGKLHHDLPDIGSDKPDHWWGVPAKERKKRIKLTGDTCIIDDEDFFIRGVLEIPIHDYRHAFGFGVWVSQKRENFFKYLEDFDSNRIGPFFGWLCTKISYYLVDTRQLKTMAHFRGKGIRPFIEVEPTDHPLAIDQKNGITLAKAWEIVHQYMPENKKK